MSADLTELARQLVAHRRWTPDARMTWVTPNRTTVRYRRNEDVHPDDAPDLTDPATLGVLWAMCRGMLRTAPYAPIEGVPPLWQESLTLTVDDTGMAAVAVYHRLSDDPLCRQHFRTEGEAIARLWLWLADREVGA